MRLERYFRMEELRDNIRYMHDKSFTAKRIENFLLAQTEKNSKKIYLESMPYRYIIEPTNICNLKCPLCPTSIKEKNKVFSTMTLDNFKKIIDEIKDYALELYLQNWGEPTLSDVLPEMIAYANQYNIFTYVSTNFNLTYSDAYLERLLKSGLSLLYIDMDGVDQESYATYRVGGNFAQLIENIKKVVSLKKQFSLHHPTIRTHFMVMRHNEKLIEEYENLAQTLGVDEYTVGNIQVNPHTTISWLPDNKSFVYESYYTETKKPSTCNWLYGGMVINSDGGVSPCCITYGQTEYFANIFRDSLKNIRNNDHYISARTAFGKNIPKVHTICAECLGMVGSLKLARVGDTFAIKSQPQGD